MLLKTFMEILRNSGQRTQLIRGQNMADNTYFIEHFNYYDYNFRVCLYRKIYVGGFCFHSVNDKGLFKTLEGAKKAIERRRNPIIEKNL
ncbi:hypothetical protein [Flavobacterium sp. ov086]|uniref:hypothetical protein n=1 Tax=Flavobacterium sp. ov086 TaxID=1761785 RepID=UPI000B653205|nr:hypothetical protein [Flavobacterium sp. ov086]SNS02467.1 hypothetical protein SAMN04487979_14511 [Flavobacterium sp. ov086]